MVLPLAAAAFAIPTLIGQLGEERFGLLSIIWMGIGYFSLFDLGIGRALTKLLAERVGRGEDSDQHTGELIWTALFLMTFCAAVVALVVASLRYIVVSNVLNVADSISAESIAAIGILAAGIPVVVATAAIVGIMQTYQQFSLIAMVRIPLGIFTFAGPAVASYYSHSIDRITVVLLCGRIIALVAFCCFAYRSFSQLRSPRRPTLVCARELLSFGGWLTVSSVVGPLMTNFDRVVIGSVLSLSQVTFYATPFDILGRLSLLPNALCGVLFPALSAATPKSKEFATLAAKSIKILYLLMLPATVTIFLFTPEALQLWLGKSFRDSSTIVAQVIALGFLINSVATVPLAAIQSSGRPDLVAKLHLIEVIPYLALLVLALRVAGINGAAIVWTLRALVDTIVLLVLSDRISRNLSNFGWIWLVLATVFFFLAMGVCPLSLGVRFVLALVTGIVTTGILFRELQLLSFFKRRDSCTN